jgi:hypothetical protein
MLHPTQNHTYQGEMERKKYTYIYEGDQSGRKTQLFKYHVASVIHQRIMIFLTSYSTRIMLTIDQV